MSKNQMTNVTVLTVTVGDTTEILEVRMPYQACASADSKKDPVLHLLARGAARMTLDPVEQKLRLGTMFEAFHVNRQTPTTKPHRPHPGGGTTLRRTTRHANLCLGHGTRRH